MKTSINQLNAKRLQNKQAHKCSVTEEDYKRILPKIEMIKRLSEIERSIYAVYDMNTCNYLLKSDEQIKLFGFTNKNDSQTDEAEIHYSKIHPDDLPFVLEADNMAYHFFSQLSPKEKKDYKLIYDFRTRNMEGIYMRHMHQSVILELDGNGKAWLTLVISHPLSERPTGEKPQRKMINIKTGKLHLFNTANENPDSGVLLTKRETEILNLISLGYDSINISTKLHISVNTVNNHRQNILRKTRTENTTQALLYCKRLGII